jgi:excisionase family DNA binding protein
VSPATPPAPELDAEELLTMGHVSAMLQVSEETVRRWVRKKLIAYELVGPFRLKRIRRSEVIHRDQASCIR